jgi:hypothetical protein
VLLRGTRKCGLKWHVAIDRFGGFERFAIHSKYFADLIQFSRHIGLFVLNQLKSAFDLLLVPEVWIFHYCMFLIGGRGSDFGGRCFCVNKVV